MNQLFKSYRHKKVLVTGGCGFIGSHLVEKLLELGAQVRILDNLSTGSLDNLSKIKNHRNLEIIRGDIRDKVLCKDLITKEISHIFHLAAFISVPESIEKPELCHEINVTGTAYLLKRYAQINSSETHERFFVFSSSSAVYGDQSGLCSENDPPHPQSPYAQSKLAGEKLLETYSSLGGFSGYSLRYFNVYGPRQNPYGPYAGVVAKFRENLSQNKPITIYGNGEQTRDFIPVQDVVRANLLMGCSFYDKRANHEVYNIATGSSISLNTLLLKLKTELQTDQSPLSYKPARPGDIMHSQADISRFTQLIKQVNLFTQDE